MAYIDGFVAAVPAGNRESYLEHATSVVPIFREFGVRRMVETWGDDVPEGQTTDFYRAVKAKDGEVIVFAWLEYPDKAARQAASEKMMTDPRMQGAMEEMPFDAKRMIYGGFEIVSDERAEGRPSGYVDGSLVAVPNELKAEFVSWTNGIAKLFIEHGASRVVDAWGDDVPDGHVTDFKGAVKAGEGETVAYTWVEWPDRAARDKGWKAVMADERMHQGAMPFDGQRMVFGGFSTLLDA